MKSLYYLLFAFIVLITASCGKDGAQGPAGPTGATGPTGPQGPPGTNGTIIYSGTAVPTTAVGVVGDFYINLATGIFYGPKTASGWGTGISLVGPKGAAGTNGTVIYSGNGVPSASIGVVGDFYIDLSNGVLYGPKTATGWATGISLVGGALGPTYPAIFNTIITPAVLNVLQTNGTVINSGLTPPNISGIYLLSPDYCSFDNSGNNLSGRIFDDYKYQFTNQDNNSFAINVNYKDVAAGGTDAGSDVAATYITGSGNAFTIIAQLSGTSNGIPYTSLEILSGTVTANGIANFQKSEYLESKGSDPSNLLEPVGSTRIFEDQDGLSATQTTFSVKGNQIQSAGANQTNPGFSALKGKN